MKSLMAVALLSVFVGGQLFAQEGKMFVAIDKFDSSADVSANQFETLRTRIQHRILGTRRFDVVERQQMKQALSEQKLLDAGLTDAEDAEAPEYGKMKAAGYVIYGNILFFGRDAAAGATGDVVTAKMTAKVEIQLKITNAENGKILASKVVTGIGTTAKIATEGTAQEGNWSEQIERAAVDSAAAQVVDALRELAFPAKVIKVTKKNVIINMTKEEVEEDDIFEVIEDDDEELVDPDTGESLGSEGEAIVRIRITRPGPKTSVAEPEDDLDLSDVQVGYIVRRVPPEKLKKEAKKRAAKKKANFESRF